MAKKKTITPSSAESYGENYELIVSEKPKSAQKIAEALADGKPVKKTNEGVGFYLVTHGDKDIIVTSTVGHIFGLTQKVIPGKKKWIYPVFDVEWLPLADIKTSSEYSRKYLNTIKKLSKNAKTFTIATDYDMEGEVIGLNVVRFACGKKDASRMKFSTLTKPDLKKAYEKKSSTMDWPQAEAGLTRHELDYYYGINLSRALIHAIKAAGSFKILSSGRVQGPTLKIIVDKEKEIKAFIPVPYWQIQLLGNSKEGKIIAWHQKDKFWEKTEADDVLKKTNNQEAVVEETKRDQFEQKPPHPFDLTSLQTESYRAFGISPKETLDIGQQLYTDGLISYPRTSSQQLPEAIGYSKVLEDLSKQPEFKELCAKLLKKENLKPNNGEKSDPAHPAIYPTGINPVKLMDRKAKVYELIVRRFLATFADSAMRETMVISINVNSEIFVAKGTRTVSPGWHTYYKYIPFKEEELPNVKEGQKIDVESITIHDKETQPPRRFTPASIIRELEKRNLGTKATRANIVETLFSRHYVHGDSSIEATELGIRTTEILEKYSPGILDEELTKHFEIEMDEVREGKKDREQVLAEARESLTIILEDFKKKEKQIGEELLKSLQTTRDEISIIGKCPNCETGNLRIISSRAGSKFIACNAYPACKTTFSLPRDALVKPTKDICKACNHPIVLVIRKGKRPWNMCINSNCPEKIEWMKQQEEKAKWKAEQDEKQHGGTTIIEKEKKIEIIEPKKSTGKKAKTEKKVKAKKEKTPKEKK
ncbi:MAG: DNA topoisomerase I [Nanoarchaeota archaeon]|nr:DNA topoisomerase I [Nanoarchaeota archaeon]